MTTLERLERANPVADADRLLSSPGAMDDFVLAVKERSGIVHTTEDRPPIELPPEIEPRTQRSWRRRLVPVLVAAAVVIAVVVTVLLSRGDEREFDVIEPAPTTTLAATTTLPPVDVAPFAGTTHAGGGVLTIGVDTVFQPWPPFIEFGSGSLRGRSQDTGDPRGFSVDLIDEMAARVGLTTVYTRKEPTNPGTADTQYLIGLSSEYDLFVFGFVPPQEDLIATGAEVGFTDPYYLLDAGVFVNTTRYPEIGGVADLQDGDVVGLGSERDLVDPLIPADVQFTVSFTNPIDIAEVGVWKAFIQDVARVQAEIEAFPEQYPNLELVEILDLDLDYRFPVDPGNEALRESLNEALASMIADGTYQSLYDQWFLHPEGSVAR